MKTAMDTDIQYLPGVGPRRATLLRNELGVNTVGDLVHLYPFRYIDRSTVQKIADIHPDQAYIQVIGTVLKARLFAKNGAEITAAVGRGSVMGCQFHPEKSGKIGLSILKAFAETEDFVC